MSYESECSPFRLLSLVQNTDKVDIDHYKRITEMHNANKIDISKNTHAGRPFAAQNMRANGASVTGTKAVGGWNQGGSFNPCYDRKQPLDGLLGAAGFNARRPEDYILPRDMLRKLCFCSRCLS